MVYGAVQMSIFKRRIAHQIKAHPKAKMVYLKELQRNWSV